MGWRGWCQCWGILCTPRRLPQSTQRAIPTSLASRESEMKTGYLHSSPFLHEQGQTVFPMRAERKPQPERRLARSHSLATETTVTGPAASGLPPNLASCLPYQPIFISPKGPQGLCITALLTHSPPTGTTMSVSAPGSFPMSLLAAHFLHGS